MNNWKSLKFRLATVYWDLTRGPNKNVWRVLLLSTFGIGLLI